MTLNTEGGLWEEDRIVECTRDEQEDYLGRFRGVPTRMEGNVGGDRKNAWCYLMSAMMLCRIFIHL